MILDTILDAIGKTPIIKFNHMSSLMEWNIMFCIVDKLFDNESKLKTDLFELRLL